MAKDDEEAEGEKADADEVADADADEVADADADVDEAEGADDEDTDQSTEPTEEDWDTVVLRFQVFRRFERLDGLQRAEQLPVLLSGIAQEVYGIANELERTGTLCADLSQYGVVAISERISFNGYAIEVRDQLPPLDFVGGLPPELTVEPAALRAWAHGFKNESERAQNLVRLYRESLYWARGGKEGGRGGRLPSVSQYWLFFTTDQWGSSIPEIARQLLERNVLPEGDSEDPNLQRQWETNLKKGRARFRSRRSEGADEEGDGG